MPKKRSTNTAIARRLTALEQKLDTLADRHAPQVRNGLSHRAAHVIENFGLTRILAAAGAWLVFVTVISFWFDYAARSEERTARAEEAEFRKLAQVATAWEVLLRPVGGDTGKGNALNTLVQAGEFIDNADLSCSSVGTFSAGKCAIPPQFNGLELFSGEFWALDQTSVEDWGMDYLVRPSLGKVNFHAAQMTGLRAHGLELDHGFGDVKGRDWHLRFLTVPEQLMGVAPPFAGFECLYCAVHDSILPWSFFRLLGTPTLTNVVVQIPEFHRSRLERDMNAIQRGGDEITPEIEAGDPFFSSVFLKQSNTGYLLRSFVDGPPLFVWTGNPEADPYGDLKGAFSRRLDLPAVETIFWDIYNTFDYCVNKRDYDELLPHLTRLHAAAKDRREIYNQKAKEEGRESLVVIDTPPPAWEADRTQPFHVMQAGRLTFDTIFAPVPAQDYLCGMRWEEVEPLLRPRLLEMRERSGF